MSRSRRLLTSLASFVLVASAPGGYAQPPNPAPLSVHFELNDAQVKGLALGGVAVRVESSGQTVASGQTGADGRWAARLAAGTYQVSYRLDGYVPYTSSGTEVNEDGQVVTVSLSRLLEATEEGGRDVRIILNWGSRRDQVRDADSHLACACGAPDGHVYYQHRLHGRDGHKVELDVDDTDWGGPETITLTQPAAGSYVYWVHDYSGPPATLGASDVVVRVVIGSQEAGEFRIFKGVGRRSWRPFKAIEVSPEGRPTLLRFTEDEIAEGADLIVPGGLQPDAASLPRPGEPAPGDETGSGAGTFVQVLLGTCCLLGTVGFVIGLRLIRRLAGIGTRRRR